ncbi:DNRLRE domain-containing protein [Micromonospora sp. NBC_01796]|uniref:DNRLRE domain-containing protein n=1 Tax=Micromonospora sp. NBC_01796 TaxID=2975987 RepID=UPI002DDBA95D|nr:DNRLRE domain-containing protein [Micromonospora sp. NBC_01796]WSA85693.1 DNRLRE domain-containing protein [Micromonospora sp. NBC_01796]
MRGRKFSLSRMLGTSTVLAGLLLGLVAAPASAGSAASPAGADEAARARATGASVEIVGWRTATQRVYANPDGTRRAVFSLPTGDAAALSQNWLGSASWTSVSSQYPNQPYWLDSVARVGYLSDAGSTGVWRSLFQFDTAALQGKVIENATFQILLNHSWSCQPTPVQFWQTAPISPSTTWSTQGPWLAQLGQVSASAYSGCGQSPRTVAFGGAALRNLIQEGASASSTTATVGLRAASETNQTQWKRFTPANTSLTVVYSDPLPPVEPTHLS